MTKRSKEMVLAQRATEKPDAQCCFALSRGSNRCPRLATFATTFHGFTRGLSWCDEHVHIPPEWPHGIVAIECVRRIEVSESISSKALSVDQSADENKRAFVARLKEAGWPKKEAAAEWERIQTE